jgi:ATP-dependent RNA helicase DeaD
MAKFSELGLSDAFLKNLEGFKFSEPTEIQEKAIPLIMQGKDLLGGSSTGSGKTLAFGAPLIEKINHGNGIQALILTPTRELAEQVSKTIQTFSRHKDLSIVSVYGGVSMGRQIDDLRYADIVVATPGRLLDHFSQRTINLSKVRFLVLDEADRMLDMGFIPDVKRIISHCPTERQTLLFSATISHDILSIAKYYMKNPVEVSVESYVDPAKLTQVYYDVEHNEKFSLLVQLLKQEDSKLVMVFCNTKRVTDFIARNLRLQNIDAMPLHGDLSQNRRQMVLDHFHKSEKFVLVCTDVAARGLDIKEVSHVYNYDIPKNPSDYVHRIGRTARAGKDGKAINLVCGNDYENFDRIKKSYNFDIVRAENPEFEKIMVKNNFRKDMRIGRGSSGRASYSRGRSGGGRRVDGSGFRRDRRDSEGFSEEGRHRPGGRSAYARGLRRESGEGAPRRFRF